jgi:uncharacterized protein (DUF362 family)
VLAPLAKDSPDRPEIIIAESSAWQPTQEGFSNYGYRKLEKDYGAKLVDLDAGPTAIHNVVDDRFFPRPVRMATVLLDPESYVVSAAVLKTHDRVVSTLSLKNVAVGAAIKTPTGGRRFQNDKPLIHGGRNNEGIHFNLFQLSRILSPDLAVIDGFEGMEGNGPVGGSPVDHKIAIASADWLAADRIGVEVIGVDLSKVGYLHHAAAQSSWKGELSRIEVLGASPADHVRAYRLHDNIERQLRWHG